MRPCEEIGGRDFKKPQMYKIPYVIIEQHERTEDDVRRERHARKSGGLIFRKLLFAVSFKCSRVEIFFLLENTGLTVRSGDIVIVEAACTQAFSAREHHTRQGRVSCRKSAAGNTNPNAQLYDARYEQRLRLSRCHDLDRADDEHRLPGHDFNSLKPNSLKPKAIERPGSERLRSWRGMKQRQSAPASRRSPMEMEILDAERQWWG